MRLNRRAFLGLSLGVAAMLSVSACAAGGVKLRYRDMLTEKDYFFDLRIALKNRIPVLKMRSSDGNFEMHLASGAQIKSRGLDLFFDQVTNRLYCMTPRAGFVILDYDPTATRFTSTSKSCDPTGYARYRIALV